MNWEEIDRCFRWEFEFLTLAVRYVVAALILEGAIAAVSAADAQPVPVESGAAGFADPARAAARPAIGRARNGHPAAIGAGRRGAQPAGARHQCRGRGRHRLSAAGDRAACRRPGRAGGAAAADRCGAPGDPAALPRRRLRAHHRLGQSRQRRHGCASSSPRAASPASSSTATSARPATQVLRFLNRLTEKQPIDTVTLERYLLLAQDVPGVSLRAVLEPSTDTPGALNLIAQVSRQKISGLATIDNRAFNQTGPIEFLGLLDFNSFTEFGEKTEVSYYHAFPNSQNFGQVSTEAFIGASGLKGKVYGGYGATVPTGSLGQQGYNGTTTVFGASLSYPVIRSRQQTLNVNLAFDALDSNISIAPNGTPRARASYDALRVLRLGADYALSDLWLGADRSAVNAVVGAHLARPEAAGRLDQRQFADIAAPGRADRFHQDQLRGEPHADPVHALGGRQRRADGPAHRAVVRQHPAAGGAVLSRRRALHPRLLCRPGAGRQGAGGDGRAAAQHRLRNDRLRKVVRHLHPVSTCSTTGARPGRT